MTQEKQNQLIEKFLQEKEEAGDINSSDTIRSYRFVLLRFLKYLTDVQLLTFENYGRQAVKDFMDYLKTGYSGLPDAEKEKKKSDATVKLYIKTVQQFTRFLDMELGIDRPNVQKIRVTKIDNLRYREPKSLTPQQISRIFTLVEKDAKYTCVIRLLHDLGLRISEALNLNIGDYDAKGARVESRPIRILGKNDKVRELLLPKDTAASVRDWEREREEKIPRIIHNLDVRIEQAQKDSKLTPKQRENKVKELERKKQETADALFISEQGGRLQPRAVQDKLNKIQKIMEITHDLKSLHPHLFRHTALKTMANKGAQPSDIAAISGHASMDMVLRYTGSSVKDATKFLPGGDE